VAPPKLVFLVTEDWYFCSHRLPAARAALAAGFDVVVATRVRAHGDQICDEGFALRPIRWIGRRWYAASVVAGNRDLLPVRVCAGALGSGLPQRALYLSPEHALLLDGMLVPARDLVNGDSIRQENRSTEVTYFHLEFDSHDAIFAEGTLAESFVDDESRLMFDNAGEYFALYPNARPVAAQFCAPRVEDGEQLERLRRRLARVMPAEFSGATSCVPRAFDIPSAAPLRPQF